MYEWGKCTLRDMYTVASDHAWSFMYTVGKSQGFLNMEVIELPYPSVCYCRLKIYTFCYIILEIVKRCSNY